MTLDEVRAKITDLHGKGVSRADCVVFVAELPINGETAEAFQFIDIIYQTAKPDEDYTLTDVGNARRLIAKYGSKLRYSYERGKWLVYNGRCWEWDNGAHITKLAQLTARDIYREAADEPDDDRRKALAKHAKSSESDGKISAMVSQAQAIDGVPVTMSELDRDPWLLNVQNGTIDLRTGQVRAHSPADLITVCLPIEYDPAAQCPLWLKFLDRVMAECQELIWYLQRLTGYALTGITKAQMFAFFYGLGQNGKSTFINTVREMLGPYATRVGNDVLMLQDKGSSHSEGLANLQGKRLVSSSETEDGRKLAVSLVKDMTGGESIRASRKYEHEIEYQPTFKLWLFGNHKPIITDTTLSIWRRVKLVPFTVTIPESERDDDLADKLKAEYAGILAWAVRGCLEWQKIGLAQPDAVTTATATYRHDQDILVDFLEDCCVLEPDATIAKSELAEVYKKWCASLNIDGVTQRTFKTGLIEKGIGEDRGAKGIRLWRGVRLTGADDIEPAGDKVTRQDPFSGNSLREIDTREIPGNSVPLVTFEPTGDKTRHPDYSAALGMPVADFLAGWVKAGRPLVRLGPGQSTEHLDFVLSKPGLTDEQLTAVKAAGAKW